MHDSYWKRYDNLAVLTSFFIAMGKREESREIFILRILCV